MIAIVLLGYYFYLDTILKLLTLSVSSFTMQKKNLLLVIL